MTELPSGAWPSPITARQVARGGVRLGSVSTTRDGSIWWSEGRPQEGGRTVVMCKGPDAAAREVVGAPFNVRTRVHEYGGGAWLANDRGVIFANWEDQRLYLLPVDGTELATALTPVPDHPQADRYADMALSPDGHEVFCVRERGTAGSNEVRRDLVAVRLDGSLDTRVLMEDGHFLSNPRPSPDGRHLSWVTWEHPRMPWDGTELRVADLSEDAKASNPRTILGGDEESVFQPEWADSDSLFAVSDRTGWWNLYRVKLSGDVVTLCEREEEFGHPQWVFGMARHSALADGRLAVTHGKGTWSLSLLDPGTGELRALAGSALRSDDRTGSDDAAPGADIVQFEPSISACGDNVVVIAGGPRLPLSVLSFDVRTGNVEVLRKSVEDVPSDDYLPRPRSRTFFVGDREHRREVHALVHEPFNRGRLPLPGERPPYIALVHGGPTAQSSAALDLQVAYFTSRGLGVVAVDYGGSSGYGRAYRDRLRGEWGVVDVDDCVAVVRALADEGVADPGRLVVRGSSAGGWTVLCALTQRDVFAAGTSYYGVADLMALAVDTHDFESRYLDGLVGPLPEARALYEERSPLTHADDVNCPTLLLQGSEDKVVPPSQSEVFRRALERRGIPHAYLLFEGEQHGFRRAETVEAALEAELSFYGQALGFDPPAVPTLELTRSGSG